MKFDLRFAAISSSAERQLRVAAQALADQGIRVSVKAWDGTRCDVLVVNTLDAYGQHAMNSARRRPVKIVALTAERVTPADYAAEILEGDSVEDWIAALTRMLSASREELTPQQQEAEPNESPAERISDPTPPKLGLCRLALEPELLGRDLEARIEGRRVVLAASTGRVLARSQAELGFLRSLLAESGWTFALAEQGGDGSEQVSMSLDSFYVEGALAARDRLPPFPPAHVGLIDWPDLGAAPGVIDALKVVKTMLRHPGDVQAISELAQVDANGVSACLWAFSAAGLLNRHDAHLDANSPSAAMPSTPKHKVRTETIGKLVRHFGLS